MNVALRPAKLATAQPVRALGVECAILLALTASPLEGHAAPPVQTVVQPVPTAVAVPAVPGSAVPSAVLSANLAMPGPVLPGSTLVPAAPVAVPAVPAGNNGLPRISAPIAPQPAVTQEANPSIQLVNMSNESTGKSPGKLNDAQGQAGLGARGSMCVVSPLPGRGVRLTFRSGNGAFGDGRSWTARHAVTGAKRPYRQSVSLADGSAIKLVSADPAGTYDVPAAAVAKTLAACPPGGNVIKWSTYQDKEAGVFSDSVTVTAVPL